jgi:hypothetical protein
MAFDNAHSLWIGTNGGGLFRYNIGSNTFETFMGDAKNPSLFTSITISSLYSISKDSLLIATKGKGLVVMNTVNKQFNKIDLVKDHELSALNNSIINAIYKITQIISGLVQMGVACGRQINIFHLSKIIQ